MLDVHEFLKQHPPAIGTDDADNEDSAADTTRDTDHAVADSASGHAVTTVTGGGVSARTETVHTEVSTSRSRYGSPYNDGTGEDTSKHHRRTSDHVCDRSVAVLSGDNVSSGEDLDSCRETALRLLDAAPRSSGALRERLLSKGYPPDVIDEVILRLQRVELIDDQAYAQSAVHYCVTRMMGRRGALMEMIRKGVDRQLAEESARIADEQGAFTDAAWQLGRSVASKTSGLPREVRRRRFWSAGGRKGHNPEILREIAHELFDSE